MKKLILISMIILPGLFASAGNFMLSEIHISFWNNSKFEVSFDNQFYTASHSELIIPAVSPGYHHMELYKIKPGHSNGHNHNKDLVYSGFVYVPSSSEIHTVMNSKGMLEILSIIPIVNTGYNPGNYYLPMNGMSEPSFSFLKSMMCNTAFDSKRLTIAKQAISQSDILSFQVLELMELLTFESSKLELAKFAYAHACDPENYFVVNDAFDFLSSSEELNRYIFGGM